MIQITVAVAAVGILLLVLAAIVRFSIVSSLRRRGANDRLRSPAASDVERVCGFPPPPDLVQMYQEGHLTSLVDVVLIDKTQQPNKRWLVGGFYPLTAQDVREQRSIHGIKAGIPIADDMGKGVYFVTRDGRIMFRPAGREPEETEVASSATALSRFEVVHDEE